MGRLLEVDLDSRTARTHALDERLAALFVGGRGLGTALLVERFLRLRDRYPNPFRAVDPLAPENPLIISTSPPNGTTVPTSARFHANFKSPLTGGIGSTNSGGRWGIEFKRTGHDAMVVIGRWSRSSARWPVAKGRSAARSHRGRSAWPNATATRTRRWP